jgi:hypothetical protein
VLKKYPKLVIKSLMHNATTNRWYVNDRLRRFDKMYATKYAEHIIDIPPVTLDVTAIVFARGEKPPSGVVMTTIPSSSSSPKDVVGLLVGSSITKSLILQA